MVDGEEPTASVEETLLFLSKMSFPAVRSFSDESDEGNGPHAAEADPLAVKTRKAKPTAPKPKYPGPRCSVLYCTNKKDDCDPEISFHRFPKSPAMQRIWAKRTRPPLTANLQNRFVCAIHFDIKVLKEKSAKDSKRRLKRAAMPTLHLPPEGEDGEVLPPEHDPTSEADMPSELEVDVEDSDLSGPQMDPTRDIEMVELSSEEEEAAVAPTDPRLTTADALAATSALHIPTRPTGAPKTKPISKQPRKSFGVENSPVKSIMEGSLDGSYMSDEEGDDDDNAVVPSEELDYIDLESDGDEHVETAVTQPNIKYRKLKTASLLLFLDLTFTAGTPNAGNMPPSTSDPLERAYIPNMWKNMNEKQRRGALRAYFSRIASYLPPRFARNSKMAILESAMQYIDEVTKSNAVLAVEDETLQQKHYRLRNVLRKLERKSRRRPVK